MAAPVDAARTTYDGLVSGTSHIISLAGLAPISAGDILLAKVRCPASTTISWPAGWTEIVNDNASDATDDVTSVAWRIADGTETTVTVTLGTARLMAGICYRITGGDMVEISAVAIGSASQPNSPNYAPFTSAPHDVLWLSLVGGQGTRTLTSGPSGYSNATIISHGGGDGAAGTCFVAGASKGATAVNSEDPGAWTLDSTTTWSAFTVAVYTAAPQARMSQEPVEAVILPTDARARLSQEAVETVILPTDAQARVSQIVVEIVAPFVVSGDRFYAVVIQ